MLSFCVLILITFGAFALDYDPEFHVRHRYNKTLSDLKERKHPHALQIKDPYPNLESKTSSEQKLQKQEQEKKSN